ncbi:MAG TPA: HPF/RaiA family ribosome-associated protein [Myxococcaceae bacterium]|nr:HPF/RaiA family ribosome-associated protein [Myxococcaceae bacterium]
MDFEIRFQGFESSDPLREHAEILVLAHLGRFRSELTQVCIVLGRRNGGSRPTEIRCEITATGPRLPGTTVDHRGLNAFPALSLAIQRAARAVRHDLGRGRGRSRSS